MRLIQVSSHFWQRRRAIAALSNAACHYNNLEFDLPSGERGPRAPALEHNLALLCESEAATVVNNCAAALVLAVRHFTRDKPEVIISRGELVQIGGGFRIPEILETSGARLREVGTTNRTSLDDYASAISPDTGLVLKVHRSNFYLDGFVASPSTHKLAALARQHTIPFLEDLGSGAVFGTEKIPGLEHEPTPAELMRCGVDLVTFSGDKLFGGPQAGIVAGKAVLVSALKRNPFFRALRCDKLILSAMEATADLHLNGLAGNRIPVLAMLSTPESQLCARAERILKQLDGLLHAEVRNGRAKAGGGCLPRSSIPSVTLELSSHMMSESEFAARLRAAKPRVSGCVSDGCCKLDLRAVFPRQDEELAQAIRSVFDE